MAICMPNNIVCAVYVIIHCYSTLEMIHKKHVILISKKKPTAFSGCVFDDLINSCKIAGSSPNLPCQQH